MTGTSEQAYQTAIYLIDEGSRSLAKMYKDSGLSVYRSSLTPREHADLVFRLALALTDEERVRCACVRQPGHADGAPS